MAKGRIPPPKVVDLNLDDIEPGPTSAAEKPLSYKERIKKEKTERVKACLAEINLILEKYGCKLGAMPRIENGLTVADVGIEAE